ncbi:hypothetical protein [Mycoplasmopsis agassizii]|nr:hypothetical protein [Mycoplasmopsis agassizii]
MVKRLETLSIDFILLVCFFLGAIVTLSLMANSSIKYYAFLGWIIGMITIWLIYKINIELFKLLKFKIKRYLWIVIYLFKTIVIGILLVVIILIDVYFHVYIESPLVTISQPINLFAFIVAISTLPLAIFVKHYFDKIKGKWKQDEFAK